MATQKIETQLSMFHNIISNKPSSVLKAQDEIDRSMESDAAGEGVKLNLDATSSCQFALPINFATLPLCGLSLDNQVQDEAPFKTLMNNLPGMVYRSRNDRNWTKEFVSVGCYQLTGYRATELLGNQLIYAQIIHPDDQEEVWNQVQAACAERKPFQFCYRITTASGEEKWVWEQGQGVYSASGELQALEGFITDITFAKRAEEESRLLQTMIQAIANADDFHSALAVAIRQVCEATGWNYGEAWIPRSDGILECSSAWYSSNPILEPFRRQSELTTFAPGIGLPGRVGSSQQPEWIPNVSITPDSLFSRVQTAQGCGLKAGFGVPISCQEQVLAVLTFFMFESRQKDERLVQLVGCVAAQLGSLMQRKQVEVALRQAEAKYRSIFENSTEGIFQTTPEGRYLSANPALARLYGYSSPTELISSLTDIEHQLYIEQNRRAQFIHLLQEHGVVVQFESQVYRRDSSVIWISENAHAVYDDTGAVIYYEGMVEDITERKTAEVEIHKALEKERELLELKTRFVSMASHEFRTPLATILLGTDLLKSFGHNFSDDKKLKQLNKIEIAAKRMTKLLDDILLISKAGAGKLECKPTIINIKLFCQELLEDIQLISTRKHKVDFDCQGECSQLEMDEKLLHIMLSNLLSNAVKYSPQGGTIQLQIICENQQAIFRVTDEGIGIPESDRSRIFELFHRSSNVGTISGTGLGMAITKKAVELHGGSITFESQVGVGTTFTVCIPTIQPHQYSSIEPIRRVG